MKDFTRNIIENIPGIQFFRFAPVHYFAYVPKPSGAVMSERISFAPGKGWHLMQGVEGSYRFRESSKQTRAGIYYDQRLSASFAEYSEELWVSLAGVQNQRLVFLIEDNNGRYWITGNKENYLTVESNVDFGTLPEQRNGVTIDFAGRNRLPAVEFRAQILDYSSLN